MKTFVSQFWLGPDRQWSWANTVRMQADDIEELRSGLVVGAATLDGKPVPTSMVPPILVITREAQEPQIGSPQLKFDL